MCRYGHQDIYRLLGRDPLQRPLTPLELAVFLRCIDEHIAIERRVPDMPDAGDD